MREVMIGSEVMSPPGLGSAPWVLGFTRLNLDLKS